MKRRISFEVDLDDKQLRKLVPSGTLDVYIYSYEGLVNFETDSLKVEDLKEEDNGKTT